MKILVTNDDGIHAKGIQVLAKTLREIPGVQVVVVAPDREQSTTSHSLTLHRPLRVNKVKKDVYTVDGTPTDAVFIGVDGILKEKPDFIFSGINHGGNLGDDIHYSGTISAAVEGVIKGIPAVAFSQLGKKPFHFDMAAKFVKKLYQLIIKNGLPNDVLLSVNIPENCQNLDYVVTKTGVRDYGGLCEERIDPRGRPYYWIGGNQYKFVDIKGSDCNAIMAGKISVTPVNINMTNTSFMKKMAKWK
ncbi:MAG: 5'/3'-nucleotidase SurE [Deltaproteobacteria bacterium]|nr:5'/3'-nucleotidase SurE [Deltaproteobacteria bacterium]